MRLMYKSRVCNFQYHRRCVILEYCTRGSNRGNHVSTLVQVERGLDRKAFSSVRDKDLCETRLVTPLFCEVPLVITASIRGQQRRFTSDISRQKSDGWKCCWPCSVRTFLLVSPSIWRNGEPQAAVRIVLPKDDDDDDEMRKLSKCDN
jgi:hypothetical protein